MNKLILTRKYIWLLLTIFLVGCAGNKPKDADPSKMQRLWHNTTLNYNYLFNADLKYQEAVDNLNDAHLDNYNHVLNLYEYPAIEDASMADPLLDEAIKKMSIAISLHRISKYTDDAYLLLGKSQYAKKEYEKSSETFSFILSEFNPEKPKKIYIKKGKSKGKKRKMNKEEAAEAKQKLEDKENKGGMFKHRAIRKDAMIWLAQSQIERRLYDEADLILQRLEKNPELYKKSKAHLVRTRAYYYLKQEQYDKAIPPLNQAIALTKGKKNKNRMTFILAQLYDRSGDYANAYENYKRVGKLRPTYEMEFNSKINMARASLASGNQTRDEVKRLLAKMLKEDKNEEYKDQLYFTLAQLDLEDEDIPSAIANLRKSLKNNKGNQVRKAESYKTLAQLYYGMDQFVEASFYYDSTLTVLPNTDRSYDEVKLLADNLRDIRENLLIIQKQDSLLAIRDMTDSEKEKLAKKLLAERQSRGPKLPEDKALRNNLNSARASVAGNLGIGGNSSKSRWWAYDGSSVKKGKRDFSKKWGQRPLEDNWRRTARKDFGIVEDISSEETVDEVVIDAQTLETLFQDVPKTDEQVLEAEGKIIDAMFALGGLYRSRLNKVKEAIEILDLLNSRFPGNKHEAESLYALYLMSKENKQPSRAAVYKNRLIKNHSESTFAQSISDPNFLEKLKQEQQAVDQYYQSAYTLYDQGQYAEAYSKSSLADSLYESTEVLRPKFALLSAMCLGAMKGIDEYKVALKKVMDLYPNTDEHAKAQEILSLIANQRGALKKPKQGGRKDGSEMHGFVYKQEMAHMVLLKLTDAKASLNDIKAAVSDYNKEHSKLRRLRVSTSLLDLETPMVLIRGFKDLREADAYRRKAANRSEELTNANEEVKFYLITQPNYRNLLRKRKFELYQEFFNTFYLK